MHSCSFCKQIVCCDVIALFPSPCNQSFGWFSIHFRQKNSLQTGTACRLRFGGDPVIAYSNDNAECKMQN